MRILVLAPHPYHIVRGTPIDLDLVLRVLTSRPGVEVDLVAYPDGADRDYPGLTIHRPESTRLTRGTKPGFSVKKLICDFLMFFKALSLLRGKRYDMIHAGEEAVFMAMVFRRFFDVPFAYDIDSSIAEQLVEKMPQLGFLAGFFKACERAALRDALITFPVCNALADICHEGGASRVVTLHDISQLEDPDLPQTGWLKRDLGIENLVLLYAGNLEVYQGIDLLIEGFALAAGRTDQVDLVILGGDADDIVKYEEKAKALGVGGRCHFIGPQPFDRLHEFLAEADILTAPRTKGRNTPMKVFPYMHSGRAVLVTDLPTHSQILTSDVAMLAEPTPEGFAGAIVSLTENEDQRRRLGERGRAFVEADHTFDAHSARLNDAYDWVERQLATR